ncbi:MAG TPA: hypothetical protein VIJ59_10495 [Caulobacteraceae bacterium]
MFYKRAASAFVMTLALSVSACSKAPTAATGGAETANAATAPSSSGFTLASDPCQALFDAMIAQAKRPYAAMITTTGPGSSRKQSETRIVDGKSYFQVDGAWHSAPQTVDQMVNDLTQVHKTATQTCKASGDEAVGGKPAGIYDAHIVNQGSASDNRLWISKETGLPLKSEAHLEGGSVVDQVFNYDNVTAPAGA